MRRVGRVGRLLERCFQENRPDDENDRARDERDKLRVNKVGPAPDAIRFVLLNWSLSRSYASIVQNALSNRIPNEEHEQENQTDDRDVVGLRDDQPEVRIERAEYEERAERAEQSVAE